MKNFKQFLFEKAGEGGLKYEKEVYKAIKSVEDQLPEVSLIGDAPSGGFNAHDVDLQLMYGRHRMDVEIKMSMNEQMGGTSVRYDSRAKRFEPASKDLDPETWTMLHDALQEKQKEIDNYIEWVQKQDPTELHQTQDGFPIKMTKEVREMAKKKGLSQDVNTTVPIDTSVIEKHYNKKGVYYIQFGQGGGLYYMGKNPFNLPVPRLNGNAQIEIRIGFSGGKQEFAGKPVRTAGLRVQGRLKFKGKSKYSLDNPKDVVQIFGE